MSIETLIESNAAKAIELRHRLHRIPELYFQEFETAKAIRAELDKLGISHVDGVAGAPTATIGMIGDPSKPCIALRADIDALPIVEKTGLAYASTHPGCMHACGHDGHMATLMGTAGVLKAIEKDLNVCVKLLWQPAEEQDGGARRMVEAGCLDGRIGPKVKAVFGLHGWPRMPVGVVASRPGVLLAATDTFKATFTGKDCHGAYPHLGVDPIVAVCNAVINLQQVVSRETDPGDAVVMTVGIIQGGTATNIIPLTASFEATVRTLTDAVRKQTQAAIRRRLNGIAAAQGCTVELEWTDGYPATVNDPEMTDYVVKIARETVGAERYVPVARPTMGGEDFAYYLEKVPGCFFLLGMEVEGKKCPNLHSDMYDFADGGISVGMKMFLGLVRNWGR